VKPPVGSRMNIEFGLHRNGPVSARAFWESIQADGAGLAFSGGAVEGRRGSGSGGWERVGTVGDASGRR